MPTAGAPPEVLAEIRDAVGGADVDLEDPNCALEVRLCVFSVESCRGVGKVLTCFTGRYVARDTHQVEAVPGKQRRAGDRQ